MVLIVKVLAALDFGDSSLEALRQARALAHDLGGSLSVCHVLPAPSELARVFGDPDQAESAALTSEEEDTKRALVQHARERVGLELAEVIVQRGVAYAEIVRAAENAGASYIVVGSHGRTGILRMVLGSVAEAVTRHAHCSVLVARPVEKPGAVVVATDLSEASLPSISEGAAAAKRSGARLVVVSVLEWGSAIPSVAGGLIGALPAIPPPEVQQQVRDALKATIEQAMGRAGAVGEARVLEGSASADIVHFAAEIGAELLVVGTRGRTGLARLALGSVAERVVRSASCSVLAVR
jgi:nucleotide-binding universal stress UspA family protein